MYNYIKGTIIESSQNLIVIEAGGIGYELNVSTNAVRELTKNEGEVTVYCRLNVREDDMSLFGFASKQEKAMFEKLVTVSGVGPKLALTVLSGLSVSELSGAIVSANASVLSKIKGVGKKTAERIVLELKDKVSAEYADNVEAPLSPESFPKANEEAVMALMTLGFTRAEAVASVSSVQKDGMTLEELIFAALKIS